MYGFLCIILIWISNKALVMLWMLFAFVCGMERRLRQTHSTNKQQAHYVKLSTFHTTILCCVDWMFSAFDNCITNKLVANSFPREWFEICVCVWVPLVHIFFFFFSDFYWSLFSSISPLLCKTIDVWVSDACTGDIHTSLHKRMDIYLVLCFCVCLCVTVLRSCY